MPKETYVRSKGCPTRTHAIPPNPPDRNDLTGSTVDLVSARRLSRSDAESDILIAGSLDELRVKEYCCCIYQDYYTN
jgi:hypothetical protein